jgi:hypothetical protein
MELSNDLILPDHELIMDAINERGFAIIKNCVGLDFIESQRNRWMQSFRRENVDRKFVRGNLILGESNFLSYSDINPWCMYRNFEFLWNQTDDSRALSVHLQIHKFRNKMQGFNENYGLEYNEDNYGIYISTSFYPSGKGVLQPHTDGHKDTPILHYMLPYTFKGQDYSSGGLYCNDKFGVRHDIDKDVEPGDIIFFDGRQEHGVETIHGGHAETAGRLAVFCIPTHFVSSAGLGVFNRTLDVRAKELANRLGILKLG